MADRVSKRVQLIEKYGKQSDGDEVFRVAPWQRVMYGGVEYLEPVDFPPVSGIYTNSGKEITSFEVYDGDAQYVPGAGYRTGGNVGLRRA
jgi:hypothetical protein